MRWDRLAVKARSAAVSPAEVRGKRGEARSHNYNLTSSLLIPPTFRLPDKPCRTSAVNNSTPPKVNFQFAERKVTAVF